MQKPGALKYFVLLIFELWEGRADPLGTPLPIAETEFLPLKQRNRYIIFISVKLFLK